MLYIVNNKTSGWFRIFGIGLAWKHESLGLRFSQRYGYSKYIKIGSWIIYPLPEVKPFKD